MNSAAMTGPEECFRGSDGHGQAMALQWHLQEPGVPGQVYASVICGGTSRAGKGWVCC